MYCHLNKKRGKETISNNIKKISPNLLIFLLFVFSLSGFITSESTSNPLENYGEGIFFDIKIIDFESPIELGKFFEFTYLLKGMANINDDVEVQFWIEKNSEIVTSGTDVIYFGNFEEKTETTKIFLPSDMESGTYTFFIQVAYREYKAKSHRTIEIEVKKGVATINPIERKNLKIYIISALIGLAAFILFFIFYLERKKIKVQLLQEERWIKKHKVLLLAFSLLIVLGILAYCLDLLTLITKQVLKTILWIKTNIPGSYFYYGLGIILALVILVLLIITAKKKRLCKRFKEWIGKTKNKIVSRKRRTDKVLEEKYQTVKKHRVLLLALSLLIVLGIVIYYLDLLTLIARQVSGAILWIKTNIPSSYFYYGLWTIFALIILVFLIITAKKKRLCKRFKEWVGKTKNKIVSRKRRTDKVLEEKYQARVRRNKAKCKKISNVQRKIIRKMGVRLKTFLGIINPLTLIKSSTSFLKKNIILLIGLTKKSKGKERKKTALMKKLYKKRKREELIKKRREKKKEFQRKRKLIRKRKQFFRKKRKLIEKKKEFPRKAKRLERRRKNKTKRLEKRKRRKAKRIERRKRAKIKRKLESKKLFNKHKIQIKKIPKINFKKIINKFPKIKFPKIHLPKPIIKPKKNLRNVVKLKVPSPLKVRRFSTNKIKKLAKSLKNKFQLPELPKLPTPKLRLSPTKLPAPKKEKHIIRNEKNQLKNIGGEIEQIHKDIFKLLKKILRKKSKKKIMHGFETNLIKTGKFTQQHLKALEDIISTKAKVKTKQLGTEFRKDKLDFQNKINKIRRNAIFLINDLTKHLNDLISLKKRKKIKIKEPKKRTKGKKLIKDFFNKGIPQKQVGKIAEQLVEKVQINKEDKKKTFDKKPEEKLEEKNEEALDEMFGENREESKEEKNNP